MVRLLPLIRLFFAIPNIISEFMDLSPNIMFHLLLESVLMEFCHYLAI
jgi:hypothetical protein